MRFSFNLICGVLVLLMASGCHRELPGSEAAAMPAGGRALAPAPLPSARLADHEVSEGQARVHLNVKGGFWSQMQTPSEKSQEFALLLESRHMHSKWAPLQSVCVRGAGPGQMACLKVSWRNPAVHRLRMDLTISEEGVGDVKTTAIDGEFFPGEEIRLKIRIEDKDVHFEVHGKTFDVHAADFKTDTIQFGCSSAECIFTTI